MNDLAFTLNLLRRYHAMGLQVSPVPARQKAPLLWHSNSEFPFYPERNNARELGCYTQTSWEGLQIWWESHPHHNIAIVPTFQQFIIDIDDCLTAWRLPLIRKIAKFATMCAVTQRGTHWYFSSPRAYQLYAGSYPTLGLDVWTVHSNHVIAPPSVHPSGIEYRWLTLPERIPSLPTDLYDDLLTFITGNHSTRVDPRDYDEDEGYDDEDEA